MYIQCKVYIQICRKWKAYNRTIVVQVHFSKCFSCLNIFSFVGFTFRSNQERKKENNQRQKTWKRISSNC